MHGWSESVVSIFYKSPQVSNNGEWCPRVEQFSSQISNGMQMLPCLSICKSTLKGPRDSTYDLYTQFVQVFIKSENHIFYFCGLEGFLNKVSYIYEKVQLYSYVKLMMKIPSMYLDPRSPVLCIWTRILNYIKVYTWFNKCIWWMC